MKEIFKECMIHLYPNGVDDLIQMRDLARTFSMGWCSALMSVSNREGVQKEHNLMEKMSMETWLPDPSWQWWK